MNFISMELALVTTTHKDVAVFFKGRPIVELQNSSCKHSTIDMATTLTSVGHFHDGFDFIFLEATEKETREGFSIKQPAYDFVFLRHPTNSPSIGGSCIFRE